MTGNKPVLLGLGLFLGLLLQIFPVELFAAEKATDLMALALKNKAAGKVALALEQLEDAVKNASGKMQKNLALFMLGDCQLELKKYPAAVRTFETLRATVTEEEERAEATFRLMQAEAFSGNRKKADRLFNEIKRNHRSSPYYELAKSFVKAQGLIQANKNAPEPKIKSQELSLLTDAREFPTEKPASANRVVSTKEEVPADLKQNKVAVDAVKNSVKPTAKARVEKKLSDSAKENTGLVKANSKVANLLKVALTVDTDPARDELVADILALQDKLKGNEKKPGMDKAIFQLAELTARFGETLEACKLYDKLLSLHPSSDLVEKAYFQAIRLRAVLGVHDAVVSWAKAFLATFPASEYNDTVKALLWYSQNRGMVDLANASEKTQPIRKKYHAKRDDSDRLKADSDYAQATRKMKDGRYNLALLDLKKLARKYPDASQVWWDMALVYVQFEDFPKAEGAIRKMLEIDPGNEEGNSLLGYIHYRLEDYQQAASAYGRAGEPEGDGVTFFDAKSAAERMKKSAGLK